MALYTYLFVASITEIIFMTFDIVLRIDMPLIFIGLWFVGPLVFLTMMPLAICLTQKSIKN